MTFGLIKMQCAMLSCTSNSKHLLNKSEKIPEKKELLLRYLSNSGIFVNQNVNVYHLYLIISNLYEW